MSDTASFHQQPDEVPTAAPRTDWVLGTPSFTSLTDQVCGIVEGRPPRWWLPAFLVSATVMVIGLFAAAYLISTGVGVWGLNQPVGWAFDITNFVFWVGIGHAGTLISAILLLLRQRWRNSINRFAEAMTLFAVACAGIFPAIHVGRIWMVWFLAPVPNSNAIWPNFRSPLLWDVFAVSTYMTVSAMFWYIGLIPDLATLRDRARGRVRQLAYGFFALGWRGSARHWEHYETSYLLLAGLSTPLVVSVHSVVSFDFAVSLIPGWHTTIFPPYFVAGAILSGFAMVLTLLIPIRRLFGLENLITAKHLDVMCKVTLATGLMVGYAYAIELFTAWYSGNPYERFAFLNRATGPYAWAYWTMVGCNVIGSQLFWLRWFRTNPWAMLGVSVLINVGMWFERFVIIVTSLHRDFLPSSWGMFVPTWVDVAQMVGAFGLFFTLLLLFVRWLPMITLFEMKTLLPEADPHHDGKSATHGTLPVEDSAPDAEPTEDSAANVNSVEDRPANVMGAVAGFRSPRHLFEAIGSARASGLQRLDAYTPFPVHGLTKALGLRRSWLPLLTAAAGVGGGLIALAGMWYVNIVDYPLITNGKPYGAVEPLVPIIFEVTILLAALATVFGMLLVNGLPRFHHPLFTQTAFDRATNDGFFLLIDARDPAFDATAALRLLGELGGDQPQLVEG